MSTAYDSVSSLPAHLGPSLQSSSYISKANRASPWDTTPHQAQEEARTKRPWLKILLFSLPIVIIITGLAVLLLAYIFIIHKWLRVGSTIQTSADLQNLLTISQVLSTFVSRSVPVVMSIHAYQLAARWLKTSSSGDQNRPSPSQLGLLITVLQGASIPAWVKATFRRSRLRSPSILTQAIFLLGLLLVVSNVIAIFDTYLHVSARAVLFTETTPFTTPVSFGRQINETQCAQHAALGALATFQTCGLDDGGSAGGILAMAKGLQTLSNSSNTDKVVYTQDQHAIMVPSSLNLTADVSYSATTYGIQTTCQT